MGGNQTRESPTPIIHRSALPKLALIACWFWLFYSLIAFSNVDSDLFAFYFAALYSLLWMGVWFIRLLLFLWKKFIRKQASQVFHPRYWLLEPVVFILVLGLAGTGVFSYARFFLSLPALNHYVEQVRTGETQTVNGWIGLYSVTDTQWLADGTVRFITGSSGLLDQAGLARSDHAPPLKMGEDTYKKLYGNWWFYHQSW